MRVVAFIVTIVLMFFGASQSRAERRLALVIGNDVYSRLSSRDQLSNAANDARAVRAALERLGFAVISGENLDRAAMIERLSDFAARLQQGDIAFFYYAGHGVSINGANYMLPSDISQPRATGRDEEERIADLAVAETRIFERVKHAGARVVVIVLDACRDNPLAPQNGRSIGAPRGLQPPPETHGVLSIYSAGTGQQALDRLSESDSERNSVFTRVFLRKLQTPGLGLRAMAFETQGEVYALAAAVGREQTPGVYSQIIGEDVYISGHGAAASAPASDAQQGAELDAAMQAGSVAALDAFLAKYPNGALANTARRERERMLRVAKPVAPSAAPSMQTAALPPAPSPPRQASISGAWSGRYYYSDTGKSVDFYLNFDERCRGRSSEPNTFGDKSAPKLFANLSCNFAELSPGQTIRIVKHYDGTGGVSHSVVYTGRVASDLNHISGSWSIGATSGRFIMQR